MDKTFIWAIVIVIIVVGGYFLIGKKENTPSETIKIGVILPLTGDFAFVGEAMKKGVDLALDDYPNSGIKLIFEDGQLDNNMSINALNKLVNEDNVTVVFNSVVNTIKTLTPVLKEKKIPGIVIWDSNKTIAGLGDYVFGMGFSTELAGEKMAEFAYNKLGVRKVSVVSAFNEWSEIISDAFITKFKSLGGTVDIHDKVNIDEKDVRVNITKIKQAQSEAIYFPLLSQSLNSLVKQSRDLGYKGYLLSADGFTDIDISNLGDYAEGIYLTNVWLSDPGFLKKYKNKYGAEADPISLSFTGMGYDVVKLVVEITDYLMDKEIQVNSENIAKNLIGFKIDGITGVAQFSKNRTTNKQEDMLIIKNGQFELVK